MCHNFKRLISVREKKGSFTKPQSWNHSVMTSVIVLVIWISGLIIMFQIAERYVNIAQITIFVMSFVLSATTGGLLVAMKHPQQPQPQSQLFGILTGVLSNMEWIGHVTIQRKGCTSFFRVWRPYDSKLFD